jgi:hypothetical protein
LLTPRGLPRPGDARLLTLEAGSSGHVGVVQDEFGPGEPVAVWTSPDGLAWNESLLSIHVGEHQRYLIDGLVVGDDGLLVLGSLVTVRPDPRAVILKNGRVLELDIGWTVTDAATGTPVGEGGLDEIYPAELDDDGASVRDPATGDVVVVIPWDVYENERRRTGVFTVEVEYDGWRLTEDETTNSYTVVNLASGVEVISGANQNYLTFGRDPELILDDGSRFVVTWDELDDAWSAGIRTADALDVAEADVPVVFHSTAGVAWTASDLGRVEGELTSSDI